MANGGINFMFNFLGFNNDNCCLYILIILLIICFCGNGCISGILDKICNSGCLLPILVALLLCNCNKCPSKPYGLGGCGCK